MKRYPISESDLLSADAAAAGRHLLVYDVVDLMHTINAAVYTGFMTAVLESKDEADALDIATGTKLCNCARLKSDLLCGVMSQELYEKMITPPKEEEV